MTEGRGREETEMGERDRGEGSGDRRWSEGGGKE